MFTLQRILAALLAVVTSVQIEVGLPKIVHLIAACIAVFLASMLNINNKSESVNDVKL